MLIRKKIILLKNLIEGGFDAIIILITLTIGLGAFAIAKTYPAEPIDLVVGLITLGIFVIGRAMLKTRMSR